MSNYQEKKVEGKLIHTYSFGGDILKRKEYKELLEIPSAKKLLNSVKKYIDISNPYGESLKYFAVWKKEYVVFKIYGKEKKIFIRKILLKNNSYLVKELMNLLNVKIDNFQK